MHQNSNDPNTPNSYYQYNNHPVSASAPPVNYPHFPDQVPIIPPYSDHTPNLPIHSDQLPYSQTPPHQFHPYSFPHLNHPNYDYAPPGNKPDPVPHHGNYDYTPAGPKPNQDYLNYDYTAANKPVSGQSTGSYDYAPAPKLHSTQSAGIYDYDTGTKNSGNYDYATGSQSFGNYDYTPTQKPDSSFSGYNNNNSINSSNNDLYGDGVYAYNPVGNKEPYGARGSGNLSNFANPNNFGNSSSKVLFDDYGRPIGTNNEGEKRNGNNNMGSRVVKAVVLKDEGDGDLAGGVQKVRAKLLSEGAGQSDTDVLCQIGLDGIRILDPATSRTLRIYPLEAVTRWEVLNSYIFAFWAKTSSDMEPKRIRLKSNSYTCNNMLDTVTAASFQIKEIGETKKPSNDVKVSEQASEKKKGFPDWINLMKPRNEEKDYWVPDEAVNKCTACGTDFNAFVRRHHCRNCGDIFCDKCTQGRIALTADENDPPVRVCDRCMAEVTQRLTNVKEGAGKVATLQSHADLAKKLKEEMDKNRKPSTGLTSSGSGMRMKEVACPTCTVHLQVQAPSSGSETIECTVCQHPFLVHA